MTSLILGIISLFFVLVGLIPFLGIMIWIALPLLIIGLALDNMLCLLILQKHGFCFKMEIKQ